MASPTPEYDGFTMRNPANWVVVLYLTLCAAWQYVFLAFPPKIRKSVWLFPAFGLFFIVFLWILSFIPEQETSGGFISWSFFKNGADALLFTYSFLCPTLLSSCVSSWIVAPLRIGKVIFTVIIIILVAMDIHIYILTKNMRYLFTVLPLVIIALILYLWRTTKTDNLLKKLEK